MEILDIIVSAFVMVFSLGLLAVSLASFYRYRNSKLLLVSVVFLVFLIKGILLSLGLFFHEIAVFGSVVSVGFFDLVILILLFGATLKRGTVSHGS